MARCPGVSASSHFPHAAPQTQQLRQHTSPSPTAMATAMIGSNTSRKRSRHDFQHDDFGTPQKAAQGSCFRAFSPSGVSPAPLVNSRYLLAGGLDTPTAEQSATFEWFHGGDGSPELGFRRGRPYSSDIVTNGSESCGHLPAPLAREGNGRARAIPTADAAQKGWGGLVYSTVTGVAGIVWQFCRPGGGFHGFFAGGGQGYAIESEHEHERHRIIPEQDYFSGSWHRDERALQGSTGSLGSSCNADYYHADTPQAYDEPQPSRAVKKSKQSRTDDGTLSQSWILVNDSPSSRRKTPAPSTASSAGLRRPAARAGSRRTAAPSLLQSSSTFSAGRPASAAGLRSPTAVRGRALGRTQSYNSPASHRERGECVQRSGEDSPIVQETARYMEDARRREKEDDRELRRLNKRLRDMIKEGKEALGSTVTVEVETEDSSDGEDAW